MVLSAEHVAPSPVLTEPGHLLPLVPLPSWPGQELSDLRDGEYEGDEKALRPSLLDCVFLVSAEYGG